MTYQTKILNIIENFRAKFPNEYNFSSVASENKVIQFEEKFNVKLPEDYKWFILNIANGIESKGLWKRNILERTDFQNFYYKEKEYNPSIPFDLKTKVRFYPKERYQNDDDYPFEVIYDSDHKIFQNGYLNGNIEVAGYGCGTTAFLVINGAEYGNIWVDDYSSNQEVSPEYDLEKNLKRLNFSDWIIMELEREIKIYGDAKPDIETRASIWQNPKRGIIAIFKRIFK